MGIKPPDFDMVTVHTYWDSPRGFLCPLCDNQLEYAFNDGGRCVETVKGKLWVVSNYYRCLDKDCDLHKAFPMVHENVIPRKKFGKDVWERVVRYHFKYHMDYHIVKRMMWDEWKVSISVPTVMHICRYFEAAGMKFLDDQTCNDLIDNGKIMLSLDGAQPTKGDPALWIFSDRITGHILLAVLLETATADILQEKMAEIEKKYKVPITAVISDKQKNIVNAVKQFNPNIPHAFCQYHFLSHIAEPIRVKDSHLATNLRKEIGRLSIIKNQSKGSLDPSNPGFNSLYHILNPLAEELQCAVAVKGRKFEIFHGKEIFENLKYISNKLIPLIDAISSNKAVKSIIKINNRIEMLLSDYKAIYSEILRLKADFDGLRKILGNKRYKSKFISQATRTWVYKIQNRLKRKHLEYHPNKLKYQKTVHTSKLEDIWQEWVRLEFSYHEGLYHTYDSEEIEKTNNGKEQLIQKIKRHFRKWLGRANISDTFNTHGVQYAYLADLGLLNENIYEILWADSVALIEGYLTSLDSLYIKPTRKWRIREEFTGNWEKLEENLRTTKNKGE